MHFITHTFVPDKPDNTTRTGLVLFYYVSVQCVFMDLQFSDILFLPYVVYRTLCAVH